MPKKKREPGSGTVYVLDGGKPKAVAVTLGINDSRNTEVIGSGLKPGDVVIVSENLPGAEATSGNGPRLRMF